MIAKFKLSKPKQKERRGRTRLRLENLKEEDKRRELLNRVKNYVNTHVVEEVNTQWKTFREAVTQTCTETLGTNTIERNKEKNTVVDREASRGC